MVSATYADETMPSAIVTLRRVDVREKFTTSGRARPTAMT